MTLQRRLSRAALVACAVTLTLSAAVPAALSAQDLGVCKAPGSLEAARAEARRLVAEIRDELAPVEDQIRNVPFVADL
ncbi:MAG: hypothetical protein PVG07_11785, partial [Acidobacteriota bacterium]